MRAEAGLDSLELGFACSEIAIAEARFSGVAKRIADTEHDLVGDHGIVRGRLGEGVVGSIDGIGLLVEGGVDLGHADPGTEIGTELLPGIEGHVAICH